MTCYTSQIDICSDVGGHSQSAGRNAFVGHLACWTFKENSVHIFRRLRRFSFSRRSFAPEKNLLRLRCCRESQEFAGESPVAFHEVNVRTTPVRGSATMRRAILWRVEYRTPGEPTNPLFFCLQRRCEFYSRAEPAKKLEGGVRVGSMA